MLKIKNYIKAESLEQAYELNQKRTACVLGGMVWLKMGNRNIMTAIDLSGLGLDTITETEEAFVIGCMTPLHALETHKELNAYTNSAIRESVRHIVGVQFRNCATVGGSIFGRFGFSDVLTMFLALDTWADPGYWTDPPAGAYQRRLHHRKCLLRAFSLLRVPDRPGHASRPCS